LRGGGGGPQTLLPLKILNLISVPTPTTFAFFSI
jgi:hypothetical protein